MSTEHPISAFMLLRECQQRDSRDKTTFFDDRGTQTSSSSLGLELVEAARPREKFFPFIQRVSCQWGEKWDVTTGM